jgi:hypothetical protein
MITAILRILRKLEVLIIHWQNRLLVIATRREAAKTDIENHLNNAENNFS